MHDVDFAIFVQKIPVHIWPPSMDGHISHSPASGVCAVDHGYVRFFYGMRYRDPVVIAKTTQFDVQTAPEWVDIWAHLFAAFFIVSYYTTAYLFQDGIFCR